ncbi:hypothetical protein NQ315_002743, partial [Exocentrus adspersus]
MLELIDTIDDQVIETSICDNLCEYFREGLHEDRNSLKIIHFNIRSLRKHFDELLVHIEMASETFDIIVLSETGKIDSVSDYKIPNYTAYYNESVISKCDRTVVYIKNNISANVEIVPMSNSRFLRVTFITSFLSQSVINSIKKRDNLKKRLIKNYTPELETEYKTYINKLNSLIRKTKNDYYKLQITEAGLNYKKIWNIVNSINGKNERKNVENNDLILEDGTIVNDDKIKANEFNSFFVNIGKQMSNKIPKTNLPKNFLSDIEVKQSVFLEPVTKNELLVRLARPKTISEALAQALEIEAAKEASRFAINPYQGRDKKMKTTDGNMIDLLLELLQQFKNGQNLGRCTPNGGRKPIRCWTCGAEGHVRRQCPQTDSLLKAPGPSTSQVRQIRVHTRQNQNAKMKKTRFKQDRNSGFK